jgi:hypothetical protein
VPTLIVAFILFGFQFAAAPTVNASSKKNKYEPLLSGVPQSGKYETIDMVLEYQYTYQPEAGGTANMDFSASLRRKGKLDSLDIWINFFDDNGKRLGRDYVYRSGAYRGVANRSLEVKLNAPPGSSQFNFTSMSKHKRERF